MTGLAGRKVETALPPVGQMVNKPSTELVIIPSYSVEGQTAPETTPKPSPVIEMLSVPSSVILKAPCMQRMR